MNEQLQPTSQKSPGRFSQAKYHRWEFLTFDFKKMITEVSLVLICNIVFHMITISTFNKDNG